MLKITTMLVSFLTGIAANAQLTENRAVSGFDKIAVQDGVELIYTQGNASLTVSAGNPETLNNFITEVKDNELNIYRMDKKKQGDDRTVIVYLTANNIVRFKVADKATITMTNQVSAGDITIDLNSGAVFRGTINADGKITMKAGRETEFNIKVKAAGLDGNFRSGSRINLAGTVKNANIHTFGNAYCLSRNLVAGNVDINAEDNSTVFINVEKKISINITDFGKVTYTGSPKYTKWNENAYVMTTNGNNDKIVTLNYQNNLPSSSKHRFNQEKSK